MIEFHQRFGRTVSERAEFRNSEVQSGLVSGNTPLRFDLKFWWLLKTSADRDDVCHAALFIQLSWIPGLNNNIRNVQEDYLGALCTEIFKKDDGDWQESDG